MDFLTSTEEYSGRNCIYIYDAPFRIVGSFFELRNCGSVVFISQDNIDRINEYGSLMGDEFMLAVRGNDDNIINLFKNSYPYLNHYDKIGGHDGSAMYHVYAGEENRKAFIYGYDKKGAVGVYKVEACQNVEISQAGEPFYIVQGSDGYVLIVTGRQALDISNAAFADGTNVQIYTVNGSDAPKWKIMENMDGSCSFLAKDERFALTCGSDGNVYLAEYHGEESTQKWWIE